MKVNKIYPKVTNSSGKVIDYESAVNAMDDDIREHLVFIKDWNSNQEFFDAYCVEHQTKFDEQYEWDKSNPIV